MNNIVKKGFNYIKRKWTTIIEYFRYYSVYLIAINLYKNKEVYLISERGTDARDNGYHLFKYMRTKYPNKEVYYVINPNSVDYNKVSIYGNIVKYGSIRHYTLFIGAKYKISTHIMGFSPNMLFYISFNNKHRIPGKQIFLQHGVIKDDLIGLYQENTHLDIFICGALPEYQYVSKYFHYNNGEVKYTGLARYDNLHNNILKNQILIMPTWRQYLKLLNISDLKKSDYFKYWNDLLNDERIINKLKEYNLNMIFYPHYEMQPYIHLFSSQSEEITIADFNHYDVQTLLKESKLLITDFSSVFFDFAYMGKPTIYFQFDRKEFYTTHYKKGYFDYETMGFGDVVLSYDELIKTLIKYIEMQCNIPEIYQDRINNFFPLHDEKNCERIMEVIK